MRHFGPCVKHTLYKYCILRRFDSDAEVDSESDQEEKKEPIVRKRKAEKSSQPAKRKKVSLIVCISLVETIYNSY